MSRRLGAVPTALIAVAIAIALVAIALVAGCGADEKKSESLSPLGEALAYVPADAPVVAAVNTDGDAAQWKQLRTLVGRFAFGAQIEESFKEGVVVSRADFDEDVAPQLGNDLVVAVPDAEAARRGRRKNAIVAFRTRDVTKARQLLQRDRRVGTSHGAEVYEHTRDDTFTALEGEMVVAAPTRELLDDALAQRDNSRGSLTEEDFKQHLGRHDREALVRATGDLQALRAARGKKVDSPWGDSLRRFAASGYAEPQGVALDFDVLAEGATADDAPVAPGTEAPPVVRRKAEVGIGVRDPGRAFSFVDPLLRQRWGDHPDVRALDRGLENIGVDLERDVYDQMGELGAASFAFDREYAMRADLKDPDRVARTLETISSRLPSQPGVNEALRITPAGGGLYRLTDPDQEAVIGVVARRLVIASDADRARDFANARATPVDGGRGAVSFAADSEGIADRIIEERSDSPFGSLLGQALTGPLEEATGSIEAKPDGSLSGHLELTIGE